MMYVTAAFWPHLGVNKHQQYHANCAMAEEDLLVRDLKCCGGYCKASGCQGHSAQLAHQEGRLQHNQANMAATHETRTATAVALAN